MSDHAQDVTSDAFLGNIPVELIVELGRKEMLLREVAALKPDAIVDLDQTVDSPLDIRVGGKLLARGELVTIDGRVGLRVIKMFGRSGDE
jgi:flagellar motor switch protein FliN/FliY